MMTLVLKAGAKWLETRGLTVILLRRTSRQAKKKSSLTALTIRKPDDTFNEC
jgi:hypothetical protein